MSLSQLMAQEKAKADRLKAQKERWEFYEQWMREVPREFRMKDSAGVVCKFIQHSRSTIYTVLVEYPSGDRKWRHLHEDVEWHPMCHLDKTTPGQVQ